LCIVEVDFFCIIKIGLKVLTRFNQLTIDQLKPQAKELADQIIKISRSGIGGPYNAMLRSPVMAKCLKQLLDYLRFSSSLPTGLNEWAILIQARLWTAQLMWRAPLPLALKHGISQSLTQSLSLGNRPEDMSIEESVIYDFCMALSVDHVVPDDIFNQAIDVLGEQQVVDLMAVSGTYVTVAMLLNVSQAPFPEGEQLPLKLLEKRIDHVY